ncbi:ABC transporter permease [Methanoplanus sp. FWC-SCC4]|uniref:ABC transporter permease n=1 Tax=Methanochimaera problematica TaxID=2609417 RepID=A0AA97FAG3_9EURY|nr:ABC transporter permease [Methanoplanus sp. FWC-SCC4]WOF15547.1 ABC transporter permease [Methanoplanus sp. FWC-SCC4]
MNAKYSKIIAKKELRSLMSEKTIILAILLQLFIAMFSSFLLVGLTSMYNPDAISKYSTVKYPVGYSGDPSAVISYLKDSNDFVVYEMDLSSAVQSLKERKLSAVIWMPNVAEDSENPVKITLYTIQNDIQSSIVNVKLKDVFLDYEERLREERGNRLVHKPVTIVLPPSSAGSDFFEFVYGLLIPLLVFMPAIISGALIIDLITEEYQQNTLLTLMSTPVSFTDMLWGKILACFILVPLQSAGWILLLMLNGITVQGAIPILLHVSIGSFILILIGALTALRYTERTNAQFIFSTAIVVVIIFALAMPLNTANIIVRLSVGSIGPQHWAILAAMLSLGVLLSYFTTMFAKRAARKLT